MQCARSIANDLFSLSVKLSTKHLRELSKCEAPDTFDRPDRADALKLMIPRLCIVDIYWIHISVNGAGDGGCVQSQGEMRIKNVDTHNKCVRTDGSTVENGISESTIQKRGTGKGTEPTMERVSGLFRPVFFIYNRAARPHRKSKSAEEGGDPAFLIFS